MLMNSFVGGGGVKLAFRCGHFTARYYKYSNNFSRYKYPIGTYKNTF